MSMYKNNHSDPIEVSIVMPCLNEEETIGACVQKAFRAFQENNIAGEVIVSDNGSTDRSVEIAGIAGARVVLQKEKGYGCAYHLGMSEARGKYIIMGDSDNTYDFLDIMKFIRPLREGYEFVNGSRIKGKIHNGAMPLLHRYFGNPMLSFILNIFFESGFSDVYCGMKAFTKDAYNKINPVSCGMEYALELIIGASRLNLKKIEVPVELYLRKGESKLNAFSDGWRSLGFILKSYFKSKKIVKGFFLFFSLAWLILWVIFMVRENKKGEYVKLGYLYTHSDAEKKRFIMGGDLYDFVDFCKKNIPSGGSYNLIGIENLDMVRARYMLWPAVMSQIEPEFILIYKSNLFIPENYELLKQFQQTGYILKRKEKT